MKPDHYKLVNNMLSPLSIILMHDRGVSIRICMHMSIWIYVRMLISLWCIADSGRLSGILERRIFI